MFKNSSKGFPVFAANCSSLIDELSEAAQWRCVEGRLNPADVGTHPTLSLEYWSTGPAFLLEPEVHCQCLPCALPPFPEEFKILKRTVATTRVNN